MSGPVEVLEEYRRRSSPELLREVSKLIRYWRERPEEVVELLFLIAINHANVLADHEEGRPGLALVVRDPGVEH